MQQINITLGTAGHIDHGKTALVKCLTGCETDRLKEERERGMSIELGFAPCCIADMQVGIVDVPGHENFIKTMVAGASGMDAVILVVAADDGVMPQTREHLDILTLLGIRHGLVALTKVDRVSAEHVAIAQAELVDFLQGTFLDGAPIVPLSNVTGQGFDAFLEALCSLIKAIEPKRSDGVFRLPVERAFSVKGYGTVVAGIPVAGSAHAGDEVVLLPGGLAGRIRRIEVYGQPSGTVRAGQCAAINVGHWDHQAIKRGDVLSAPGYFRPEEWFVCDLRLLPRESLVLKSGMELKFHTGTSEVPAKFFTMQTGALHGGAKAVVQIRTMTPLAAGPGDRFILRTLSPVRTVGGGMIVEAVARRMKRNRPEIYEDLQQRAAAVADQQRFVEYCLRHADGAAATEDELAVRAKLLPQRLREILAELVSQKIAVAMGPGLYAHSETPAALGGQILQLVRQFHERSPESPGLPLDQLRQSSPLPRAVLDGVVAALKTQGRLVERSQRLALPGHQPAFCGPDAPRLQSIEAMFRQSLFQPPGEEELAAKLNVPAKELGRMLKVLRESGRLVSTGGILFHADAVERAKQILFDHFQKEPRLESVDFKYMLDTSRKFALPLLDHLDQTGVTRRVGNTRYPKNRPG